MNGFGPIENGFISAVNGALILAVTVAGVVALLLTVVFSRRILEPIESLTAAARKMENGDLSQRVSVRSKDEIGTLTHAFNAMADGLARLENLRRNMVTDVAHELRTPLTNIRGYLEALRDGMIQPGPALINSLHEEAMLLNRLIDDLQELALAEAGQLRLVRQMVDIREIIEQAVSAQQPSMAEKGLKVSVDLPPNLPLVEADAERIGQVLRNLLNNASVHTPANGEVRVTVQLVDAEVVVSVRDTGSGIPPTHLPYIFERFYRADKSRTRATGGAGLGLAIVKQLIEAHGGRIWAESTEGSGSVFTFTLLAPEHRVTALDWKGSLLKQRA
jgi:signal transduction histidine kinase